MAYEQIKQLNFDKAFLGINGIDEEFLTTPDMEEAVIKKTVIEMLESHTSLQIHQNRSGILCQGR